MSDLYPAEHIPMAPMMRPLPDIDQADSLPPQTLLDNLRARDKVLSAAINHLTAQMGRVTVELAGIQVDDCPAVDVHPLPGRCWRVVVDRPIQNTES